MSSPALTKCLFKTTLHKVNNIKAHFLYPKLVLLGCAKKVIIVDIENNVEKETELSSVLDLEDDIADDMLQDNFLWLILQSHELVVVNIKECSLLKVRTNNYANYKINQFIRDGNNLLLMSDSGECLAVPFTTYELENKFRRGDGEAVVTFEKLNICRSRIKCHQEISLLNGLQAYLDSGNITLQCSTTGLIDELFFNTKLEHIIQCGNSVVLADKCKMWIVDIRNFTTTFEFPNVGSKYYPLNGKNKAFYYLLWDNETVCILYKNINFINFYYACILNKE